MRSDRRTLLLSVIALALLLGLAADAARKLSIDTSMDHFLPASEERKLYRISRQLIDSRLTSRMTLTVGLQSDELDRGERRAILAEAARDLGTRLEASEGISSVTRGPPPGIENSFFETYFPRRFAYFSMTPEDDAEERLRSSRLESDVARLKDRLASPEGVLIRNLAPRDPWLLFSDFIEETSSTALRLDVEHGQFFARSDAKSKKTAPNEDFAILFLKLRDSALDASAQAPVLSHIDSSFERIRDEHDSRLRLEGSGANRFAVATEKSMKSDIERVFSLSTLGLMLLFLVFFRSLLKLAFLAVPILSGLIVAGWVTLTLFGSIHALTLAFGGALIGIAIDYPVHTLCHHELAGESGSGSSTIRQLLPTLGLAAGTTLLGLVGLGWAAFPGIREIALFSGVGVTAALTSTIGFARLLPSPSSKSNIPTHVASALFWAFSALQSRRWIALSLMGAALAVSATSFATVQFAPGLESLAPLDRSLLQEEERVKRRIGEVDGGTLAISLGPDLEHALVENERVYRTLRQAHEDGLLHRFENVAMLLRSSQLQKKAQRVWTEAPALHDRTLDALEKQGFVPAAFPDLRAELDRPLTPLTLADLEQSPLHALVDPFLLTLDDEVAVVTPLSGVADPAALAARVEKGGNSHLLSQKSLLDGAYADLRARTTELLIVGLLFVFGAGLVRYRSFRTSVALLLPAALAAGATVGMLSLLSVELNILHLLGLLLVCSMGVDYSVFLLDSPGDPRPALLSITIGCVSTMLSFGALGLSTAPALRALGITIAIGIVLSLLLAPTAQLILPSRSKNARTGPS